MFSVISNKEQSLTNFKMDRVMTLSNSEEGLLEMDQKTGLILELFMFLREFLSRY